MHRDIYARDTAMRMSALSNYANTHTADNDFFTNLIADPCSEM